MRDTPLKTMRFTTAHREGRHLLFISDCTWYYEISENKPYTHHITMDTLHISIDETLITCRDIDADTFDGIIRSASTLPYLNKMRRTASQLWEILVTKPQQAIQEKETKRLLSEQKN